MEYFPLSKNEINAWMGHLVSSTGEWPVAGLEKQALSPKSNIA
jgi:hypothetical protein